MQLSRPQQLASILFISRESPRRRAYTWQATAWQRATTSSCARPYREASWMRVTARRICRAECPLRRAATATNDDNGTRSEERSVTERQKQPETDFAKAEEENAPGKKTASRSSGRFATRLKSCHTPPVARLRQVNAYSSSSSLVESPRKKRGDSSAEDSSLELPLQNRST